MQLDEYQRAAMATCMQTSANLSYMLLNLIGEVGEFTSKIAKHIRKGEGDIISNDFYWNEDALSKEQIEECNNLLKSECGDIFWQISGLCKVMGWTLEEVAEENISKLASRKVRGVIDGNGDNR